MLHFSMYMSINIRDMSCISPYPKRAINTESDKSNVYILVVRHLIPSVRLLLCERASSRQDSSWSETRFNCPLCRCACSFEFTIGWLYSCAICYVFKAWDRIFAAECWVWTRCPLPKRRWWSPAQTDWGTFTRLLPRAVILKPWIRFARKISKDMLRNLWLMVRTNLTYVTFGIILINVSNLGFVQCFAVLPVKQRQKAFIIISQVNMLTLTGQKSLTYI